MPITATRADLSFNFPINCCLMSVAKGKPVPFYKPHNYITVR
jgi:hypothetical protein